jgi:hypothetical protein
MSIHRRVPSPERWAIPALLAAVALLSGFLVGRATGGDSVTVIVPPSAQAPAPAVRTARPLTTTTVTIGKRQATDQRRRETTTTVTTEPSPPQPGSRNGGK